MTRKRSPATHRGYTDVEIAQQMIECYSHRLSGKTYDDIVKLTGLSKGTVITRVRARIEETVLPLADEVRKIELDRLDRWLVKLDGEIEAGLDLAKNIATAVRVSERRCKLLGADAPERVEATVTEISQEDVALAELVREAQAAAALAEHQLRGGISP